MGRNFAFAARPEPSLRAERPNGFRRLVRPAQRSLALRPAHSRGHLYVTSYTEGFSHFVTSMTAPVASGWSVRRVGLAPTGKRRLVTAHTVKRTLDRRTGTPRRKPRSKPAGTAGFLRANSPGSAGSVGGVGDQGHYSVARRKAQMGSEFAAERADRLASLVTLSYEPMFAWHLDGSIEFWNAGAVRLYGFALDEAIGRSSHSLANQVPNRVRQSAFATSERRLLVRRTSSCQ